MKRALILEDGTVFQGEGLGSDKEVVCEIVFNTSMTGYIEIMTDPSCVKQAVVMTYPLIGNYGFMDEDNESEKPWIEALIARELCEHDNNFRSEGNLEKYLNKYDIPALYDIDTRALTKLLREKGTMLGLITTDVGIKVVDAIEKIKKAKISNNRIEIVSVKNIKHKGGGRKYNVAVMDFGIKDSIIQKLVQRGCNVTLYPWDTKAEVILDTNPEGIMLSGGPGNPKEYTELLIEIKKMFDTETPMIAIGLGHQLLALANGANTVKLKYHRAGSHSIKDLRDGSVYPAPQNHGYVVEGETMDPSIGEISHIDVNDKTVEGINYIGKNVFSIQFCPGSDTDYLFDKFVSSMDN